jgi:hypothetical protein
MLGKILLVVVLGLGFVGFTGTAEIEAKRAMEVK